MKITEAKQQIENAMRAYFDKDEFGNYRIPVEEQRPVFLMGPPGLGKTAVVQQVAAEMGVGLVSYSMTHHTRQSALGLPFIQSKKYGGRQTSVTEYTMSEIIAAVYDVMEETGVREGILFLDEINCVSETLTPAMLEFLQFKRFGRHQVPPGWIVLTAGNPPEYNRSAHEFDYVTWDRLKRVDVEPDFDVWKKYAYAVDTHAAILTYLEIKKENFYRIETAADGRRFVTARGWTNLSVMLREYERLGLPVDVGLIGQYLQFPEVAEDFANYFELFAAYQSDYQVDAILAGRPPEEILQRARHAEFDERLSLLGLLLDAVAADFRDVSEREAVAGDLLPALRAVKSAPDPGAALASELASRREACARAARRGALDPAAQARFARVERFLQSALQKRVEFAALKTAYDELVGALRDAVARTGARLQALFSFAEAAFDENEMLILVAELTCNPHAARFIGRYGCAPYYAHNEELLFYERQKEIITELEKLDLELK